ncbi:superoxide dismutase [Candidatus Jorgensenbacteria bacterium GWA1_49_17]|uniref:Superoxide dismutase n=2 Tax=Candidatus Joergenseniibacteriota TaxID=1752739 RepID=A0A1F6BPM2_9BACT|nr:MAG: superoxide dismutase [Candidatus Jorgensenbacteria bacterium GWC1_48_12]OGG40379.1 MAG: superoxide dismutase [Candidatus Jorgensenbacteria bacterium GWA1_49_17]
MTYELPKLPYSYNALEPYIDAKTMEIHHTKHHQGYVDKLNKALEGHADLAEKPLEDLLRAHNLLPEEIRTAVRNNGGGHFNHSFFWKVMAPNMGGELSGDLAEAIGKNFGSLEKFKEEFTNAALNWFGSGWAWLSSSGGKLEVYSTPNQDSPLMDGKIPILGLDVWEHAYYLKYQNKRPDYIAAWWSVVNWAEVEKNYGESLK